MRVLSRLLTGICCLLLLVPMLRAQTSENAAFSKEELEQLVAPIALYPDPLVAQVLMASTYPLEIVSAARWVKANKVSGKALEDALQNEPWDPSVKSLAAFPQVLEMMNSKLDWTQKLGDAFLAQQKDVMASIQTLRLKAEAAGNLKSTKEQVVVKEQQANTTVVKIEPANPQVVYVPTYDPVVAYGPWPYPAYPPYYYYPPGYAPGAALLTFGVGLAVGAALWGDCDWGGGDVNINAQKFNNFNRTNVKGGNWQHNVEHRKGVGYRDNATAQKYGRGQQAGADSREAFRGRAEQGRREIQSGAADRMKGQGAGGRDGIGERGGIGDRGGTGNRGGIGERGGVADRAGPSGGVGERRDSVRPTAGTRDAGGFQGVGGGGAETRNFSDRGAASRASAGGGARAGGGGFSGGGGGRAGGGGGRGGGGRR